MENNRKEKDKIRKEKSLQRIGDDGKGGNIFECEGNVKTGGKEAVK